MVHFFGCRCILTTFSGGVHWVDLFVISFGIDAVDTD
jgi:hypothetical protein